MTRFRQPSRPAAKTTPILRGAAKISAERAQESRKNGGAANKIIAEDHSFDWAPVIKRFLADMKIRAAEQAAYELTRLSQELGLYGDEESTK